MTYGQEEIILYQHFLCIMTVVQECKTASLGEISCKIYYLPGYAKGISLI